MQSVLLAEDVRRGLAQVIEAGGNLKLLYDGLAGDLEASTRQRFNDQAGPDGVAWIQSKPAASLAASAAVSWHFR
jgi:Phage virion morphogenesis family